MLELQVDQELRVRMEMQHKQDYQELGVSLDLLAHLVELVQQITLFKQESLVVLGLLAIKAHQEPLVQQTMHSKQV